MSRLRQHKVDVLCGWLPRCMG